MRRLVAGETLRPQNTKLYLQQLHLCNLLIACNNILTEKQIHLRNIYVLSVMVGMDTRFSPSCLLILGFYYSLPLY